MEIIKRWLSDEIGVTSSNGEGHFERDFANGFNFGMVSTPALPSRLAQVGFGLAYGQQAAARQPARRPQAARTHFSRAGWENLRPRCLVQRDYARGSEEEEAFEELCTKRGNSLCVEARLP